MPLGVETTAQQKNMSKSDAEHVLEFTKGAGQECSSTPKSLDEKETKFITKMILDEGENELSIEYHFLNNIIRFYDN